MFRIGEFSKIAQAPGSLLRYYDQIGLLKPAHVDQWTGYRYYSAKQLPRLHRILALKELGLTLEQITRLVEEDVSAAEIRGMLALKKAQVEQTMQEEMTRLRSLEARLQQIDNAAAPAYDIVIKNAPALNYLSVREVLPGPDAALNIMKELLQALPRQLERADLYFHYSNQSSRGSLSERKGRVRPLMAGVCPPEQTIEPPQRKEAVIMSKFTVHNIESAPEGSKPALQKLKDSVGLIPNLAAVMANAPALIEVFVVARSAYQNSSLSAIEREVVSITNAVANNCAYCVAAHSTFAQMAELPPAALAALRAGKAPADPRLKALSDFSRKLTTARGQISEADLETFLAAGFTAAQALEVIVGGVVSLMANYTNHLAHAPLDEFLQPQAWKALA